METTNNYELRFRAAMATRSVTAGEVAEHYGTSRRHAARLIERAVELVGAGLESAEC